MIILCIFLFHLKNDNFKKNKNLYCVISIYDLTVKSSSVDRPSNIEIFKNIIHEQKVQWSQY